MRPIAHVIHQGPVLATLGRVALSALVPGKRSAPQIPGPWLEAVLPPRAQSLIDDYLRHVGSEPSAWRGKVPPSLFPQWGFPLAARTLAGLPYPMLADVKRELTSALGILHPEAGVPLRATFVVDPEGRIRFVSVHDLDVGRSVDEVLRTLDALQTGELCPCNWQKGDKTLEVA